MKLTLTACLACLTLGAWGGAWIVTRDDTFPTKERRAPHSTLSTLAQSLPDGLRAVSGVDAARMLNRQSNGPSARIWTDSEGRQVRATLVSRDELTVTLRRADNTTASWPIERLSPQDQLWLAYSEL